MNNLITLVIFAATFVCLLCIQCVQCNINSVARVDLMAAVNVKRHRTTKFYSNKNFQQSLILRRGEPLQFRIYLKTPFHTLDRLQLKFRFTTQYGEQSVFIPSMSSNQWPAKFTVKSNVVDVVIQIPADVPVGFWDLLIYTYIDKNLNKFNTRLVKDILILFNPWSPKDDVYMSKQHEINEYVLNEHGYAVTGDLRVKSKKYWIHGQFKFTTVAALKIVLDKLPLTPEARANPTMVSRALSAIVNYHDDEGMMAGKWSEPYDTLGPFPARSPLSWTGTPEILEEYVRYEGRTIGYAQCWVFASVLTTLGRALGIPSRVITNFESGHDYDDNVTISYKFDEFDRIDKNFSESIWNFHVWSEMWMKRKDLSEDGWKFGGWQILDGTPQQRSYDTEEGYYQVGPASRAAVKQSEVNMKYDTGFVYAEVNADIIYRNYRNEVISYFENRIGRLILTRGLDGDVSDVTYAYKEIEGTIEERMSFNKAIQQIYNLPILTTRVEVHKKVNRDINVEIMNPNSQKIGTKIDFDVIVTNSFEKRRLFTVDIVVYSMYYKGERGNNIFQTQYKLDLAAFSENKRRYEIDPADYIYKLVPFSIVRIEIKITTNQRRPFKRIFDVMFEQPALIVNPIGRAVVGKPFFVDVQLINPLDFPLTKCMFAIQGERLNADLHPVKDVKPKEKRIHRFALVFNEAINETVVFLFTSNILDQIQGQMSVLVHSK